MQDVPFSATATLAIRRGERPTRAPSGPIAGSKLEEPAVRLGPDTRPRPRAKDLTRECERIAKKGRPTVQRRWDFSLTDRRRNFERLVHPGLKQPRKPTSRAFSERAARRGFAGWFCFSAAEMNEWIFVSVWRFSHSSAHVSPAAMVKTRIACYFDVPRADNRSDYHNFVDVRRGSNDPRAFRLTLRARSETTERRTIGREKTPSAPVRRIAHGSRPNALTPRVPSPHHRSTCARTTPRTL